LVAVSFISLAFIGSLPWWLVVLVFLRDLSISIGVLGWYWFKKRRLDLVPTLLSKCNTALQLALVTFCLFELAFFKISPYLIPSLIYLTGITTSVTFIHYLWVGCNKAWPQKELLL
jgi:cardiolipin synthase